MSSRRAQRGATMFGVLMAIVVGTILTLSILRQVPAQMRQSTFNETVTRAQSIANVVESAQSRVTDTAIDPATGAYTYSHAERVAAYTSVSSLNASMNKSFPVKTPYDTDYEFRGNGSLSEVRFLAPVSTLNQIEVGGLVFVTPKDATNSYVIVTARRPPVTRRSQRLEWVKKEIYMESTR